MSQNLNTWDALCVFDESGTDETRCSMNVRRVAGAIRSLVNAKSLQGSYMSHCWCLFLNMVVRQ